jgi:myo-inositol-1-phosphate synthase
LSKDLQYYLITIDTGQVSLIMSSGNPEEKSSSIGILVIGLGGYNGTTLLAGVVANRRGIDWHGPQGQPKSPNYLGCITQLKSKGKYGGVGFSDVLPGLASVNDAAIGGWDIRSTCLGDALLKQQILDYDLVRQVKDEMNTTYPVLKGYFDARFIGSKLHEDANHILTTNDDDDCNNQSKSTGTTTMKASDVVHMLRQDIQQFKKSQGVKGHTTVIWSASVEPNCELCVPGCGIDTADELLASLETTDEERGGPLPPSILYATAAALEGCSFVNGGSQNTIKCHGLIELAQRKLGVYILGTDFKAGQTKFKTAAVEYLRTMGLTPKVIASSNHLGNNDMKNLACSDKTLMAKLRVKHDIFAAWEEDELDHKVAVMYTPEINDEKRDFVEYTSDAFLSQTHTMVTYTRAMDSVLCVPLMLDAAVWCDFFCQRNWSSINVSKALAYLFKVPEGGAEGVDPGFFRQMEELKKQAFAACQDESTNAGPQGPAKAQQTSTSDSAISANTIPSNVEWMIPSERSTVICAGLACVDMQLNSSTGGQGGEAIETFKGVHYIGGGR